MTGTNGMHLNGSEYSQLNGVFTYPSVVLSSGASFSVSVYNHCESTYYSSPEQIIGCGYLILDIDGPAKGKYMAGVDIFELFITKNGLMPSMYSREYLKTSNYILMCTMYGDACGQWIMDTGNADYLIPKDKTTYVKAQTCPNGKILGYNDTEVTSCK